MDLQFSLDQEYETLDIIFDNSINIDAYKDEEGRVVVNGIAKLDNEEVENAVKRIAVILLNLDS